MKSKELEKIYNDMMKEYNRTSRFNSLTSLTYDLALASAENNTSDIVIPKKFRNISKKDMSYSVADMEIEGIELVRGWISFEEYAKKTGLAIEKIREKAAKGELGKVEKKKGKKVIFWSSEDQKLEELPPVDSKSRYKVKFVTKGTVKYKTELSLKEIISYLGSAKSLENKTSEASLLLNRETFLLYWSAFEQYIKKLTVVLFELFPEQVLKNKKYGKNQMSYREIFERSANFMNMQELKEYMINNILGDSGVEREIISKQITFIQDCFLKKRKNPYSTWYVFKGVRKNIDYQVLDQIRLIRNSLVHKSGKMDEEWDRINLISRPKDNRVIVDDNLLVITEMILKSVSHNLYKLILENMPNEVV